jgi:hypothetical protein
MDLIGSVFAKYKNLSVPETGDAEGLLSSSFGKPETLQY